MSHDISLITTVAAGLGMALIMGFLATRVGVPPLVGYLVAGIIVGPATPGFVADLELTRQLAEIGVMLMMFGVGLHFSLEDLMAVRRIAVPGAVVQIIGATAAGAAVGRSGGRAVRAVGRSGGQAVSDQSLRGCPSTALRAGSAPEAIPPPAIQTQRLDSRRRSVAACCR